MSFFSYSIITTLDSKNRTYYAILGRENNNKKSLRKNALDSFSFKNTSFHGGGRLRTALSSLGETVRIDHKEGESHAIHSVLDADRLYKTTPRKEFPEWFSDLADQAAQARTTTTPLILRLPDGSFMVTGTYSEAFFRWLSAIPSDGVVYDRFTETILIENPTWTEDTADMMIRCGVQSTTTASHYISPETMNSRKLKADGLKAIAEGYDLPSTSLFPTDRKLMAHQQDVVRVLAWRGKGIVADDVGSGKSSMFLGGFFSQVQKKVNDGADFNDCFPLVVVTKKALVGPIAKEALAWFKDVKVSVVGRKAKTISQGQINYPPEDAHIIVCSLSTLDKNVDTIIDAQPTGVVFDESHMVKNPQAKRTQAAFMLSKWIKQHNEHPYTVCVSATPMPNRPQELWAQLVITGMDDPVMRVAKSKQSFPAKVRSSFRGGFMFNVTDQTRFELRYCDGKPGPFGWEAKGSKHEDELSRILHDNGLIRRKKSEFISPLPPLYQGFVRCSITDKDRARYNTAQQEFRDYIVATTRRRARKENWEDFEMFEEIRDKLSKAEHSEAIMKMTAVRQLVGEIKISSIVEWIHKFFDGDPTIVRNGNNKKLIVFAHHKNTQNLLIEHPELQQYGILSIQAGQRNVNDIVDSFQDPTSGNNLLICYSEAREGLTLTASYAVLVAEIPWSPSWLLQMAGRCWARFSELYPPHEATIFYAVADVDIDNYLIDMVKNKGWLNKAIIDPETVINEVNEHDNAD